MYKKIIETLFFVFTLLGVPVYIKNYSLLFNPKIILMILCIFTLTMSQPIGIGSNRSTKKTKSDQFSMLALFITGIGIFFVPLIDWLFFSLNHQFSPNKFTVIGTILIIFGLGFRYYSIRYLGKFFTAKVQIVDGHKIIDSGPYRLIRHPSYLGAFTMAIGISILMMSKIGIAFCFLAFFPAYIYRINAEEKTLSNHFGDAYIDYMKRTKKLIPFLY